MKLLALSGSLRAASTNTALLRAAAELAPPGVALTVHDLRDIPLYDPDAAKAPGTERLEAAITAADGLVIATPEYNYGIPGALKNALDAASRPAYASVFAGKPVAVLGASSSAVGTARAQAQLKTVLLGMLAEVFPAPEFLLGNATASFTDGRLGDPPTRDRLAAFLARFATWAAARSALAR